MHSPPISPAGNLNGRSRTSLVATLSGWLWPILFAVGMRIAAHPPHRSEQALFTHSAPTSGV